MMRNLSILFTVAMQVIFASLLSAQSVLESQINDFLKEDTVEIGRAVPFSLIGKADEARNIVREKIETETEGFAFLQLKTIAQAIGDKELERSVFRRASELLIQEGLDPLSEGLIIEGFLEIAVRSDIGLLTKLMESKNLKLPNSKKFIENRIGKIDATVDRDAPAEDGTADDVGAVVPSSQRGKESLLAQEQKSKLPVVFRAIAILGILLLLIRAFLRGKAGTDNENRE